MIPKLSQFRLQICWPQASDMIYIKQKLQRTCQIAKTRCNKPLHQRKTNLELFEQKQSTLLTGTVLLLSTHDQKPLQHPIRNTQHKLNTRDRRTNLHSQNAGNQASRPEAQHYAKPLDLPAIHPAPALACCAHC